MTSTSRALHLAPNETLLGLDPRTPAYDVTEMFDGVECDLTTNEAASTYRTAATGIHLLRTGGVVANLPDLAPTLGSNDLEPLLATKRGGTEHGPLEASLDEHHRRRWPVLADLLAEAEASSSLPAEAANRAEIDAWLVRRRTEGLGAA